MTLGMRLCLVRSGKWEGRLVLRSPHSEELEGNRRDSRKMA